MQVSAPARVYRGRLFQVDLSGLSNKSLVGKALRAPLHLVPNGTQVRVLQGRLRGKRWIIGSGAHGCWLGFFEYDKQRLFARTVTPGSVVLDIGAHVGFYTLLASELVGRTGRVFAFEPLPRNLQYLREHLRLNRIANVTVVEAAVTENEGEAMFASGEESSLGWLADPGDLRVRTVGLDDLRARGIIPAPDFLKIDIEGGEGAALLGAARILSVDRPVIFLATHGSAIHDECLELLFGSGYRILWSRLSPRRGDRFDVLSELLALPPGWSW